MTCAPARRPPGWHARPPRRGQQFRYHKPLQTAASRARTRQAPSSVARPASSPGPAGGDSSARRRSARARRGPHTCCAALSDSACQMPRPSSANALPRVPSTWHQGGGERCYSSATCLGACLSWCAREVACTQCGCWVGISLLDQGHVFWLLEGCWGEHCETHHVRYTAAVPRIARP